MKTTIGSSIVVVMVLLVGLGILVGVLLADTPLFQAEATGLEAAIVQEQFRLEQQRAAEQLAFEQQQHAQSLENQRMIGSAVAYVVQTVGPIFLLVCAVALLTVSVSWAWERIAQGIATLRRSKQP